MTIKESRELSETGRADKAKMSRSKFLLQIRSDRGELLSSDEMQILKSERIRKTYWSNLEDNKENDIKDKKGKDTKIKESPKKANLKKEEEVVILPKIDTHRSRTLPKAQDHKSKFIKQFINYTFQNRTVVFNHNLRQEDSKLIFIVLCY